MFIMLLIHDFNQVYFTFIAVPPELGYTADYEPKMPTFATKRQLETHKLEPLLFEVQMLRVGDKR